jgi:hypothetical protein
LPVGGTQNSGTGVPYVAPVPWAQDSVQKMRVSTPQSLIDTDFEYGTQPTKWESVSLQNNRASCYYIAQQPIAVTAITGTSTANTINITFTGTIPNNTPIYIQNSTNSTINGWAWVTTGGSNTTIAATVAPSATVSISNGAAYFSATLTSVYLGYFYTNCGFLVGANCITVTNATTLTITTNSFHGLSAGSYIYINGAALGGTTTGQVGAFIVSTVTSPSTFTVTTVGAVGPSTNTGAVNNVIFARPSGYVEPRSFDGGVAFSAGAAVPNQQLIRQTRRYFRYQSGKGIQFSTGSSFKPPLFVNSIVNVSGTVTVTTRFNHNLVAGTTIQVTGCVQGALNGTFTVASVTSPTVLTYSISSTTSVTATGTYRVTPLTWYGSSSRLGFFDQQNGMFFEYDGQTLYAVLRNSTNQISGTVAVTQGSGVVTGTGTLFLTQVQSGQFIVIRGQTYRVIYVDTNTQMFISPEYRGATISNAIVSVTIDTKIPQSQWNLDPCNGNGPSGYNLDLTRMQMWYIDYSWYGAGYIRWGLRGVNGQVTYVHQLQNNNRQFEAYMRSGNMAAHYELSGIAPSTVPIYSLSNNTTTTTANILTLATTIPVAETSYFNDVGVVKINSELISYSGRSTTSGAGNLLNCVRGFANTAADDQTSGSTVTPSSIQLLNTAGFPPSGTIKVENSLSTEYIAYTGITSTGMLYNLSRAQTGGYFTAIFVGAGSLVELASPDSVPSLSHWGSSAIMDGRFDDDKSLIFNYGTDKLTTAASTTQVTPILAIRIAPSADNGQTSTLGNKEIINRMQLQLVELGIYSTGPLLVNLILNGYTATATFSSGFTSPLTKGVGAYTSSLAQIAANTLNTVTLVGGESVAAAFTNTNGQTTLDLSQVRDLGNSIIGGGINNTVPTSFAGQYPDGPDVLYVCVTPLVSACDVYARLSWKEAQA